MGPSRRFHAIGGMHAWAVPLVFAALTALAVAVGEGTLAALLAFVGVVGHTAQRSVIIDVSAAGVARVVTVGGTVLHVRVIAWATVAHIVTAWRRPGDCTALFTRVTGGAVAVTFTTRMGHASYRACLEAVARHAPAARRTGLTGQVLSEPACAWGGSRVGAAIATAVILLLVFLAARM